MEADGYKEKKKSRSHRPLAGKKVLRSWNRSLKSLVQCVHFIDEEIDSEICFTKPRSQSKIWTSISLDS